MRHKDGLAALERQQEQFWSKVDRTDLISCWHWKGALDQGNGYGRPTVNGKLKYAHRLSYEMHCGPIPRGLNVLHRCNCKTCVNPLHLYLGDQLANLADAKAAGVLGNKLNADAAREIFRLRHECGWSYLGLAEKFGVSPQSIASICRRRTWAKATADLVHLVKPEKAAAGKKKSPAKPRKPGQPKKCRASSEMVMQ